MKVFYCMLLVNMVQLSSHEWHVQCTLQALSPEQEGRAHTGTAPVHRWLLGDTDIIQEMLCFWHFIRETLWHHIYQQVGEKRRSSSVCSSWRSPEAPATTATMFISCCDKEPQQDSQIKTSVWFQGLQLMCGSELAIQLPVRWHVTSKHAHAHTRAHTHHWCKRAPCAETWVWVSRSFFGTFSNFLFDTTPVGLSNWTDL